MAAVPVNTTIQTQIANLYIAILGRNPEPAGFGYWCDTLANNGGTQAALNAITIGFSNSPEFVATYGGQTTEAAIALMYENILDRAPDAAGLAYWVGQANGLIGTYTVAQALALTGNNIITAAAANTGTADQTLIEGKEATAIASGTAAPTTTYTLTTNIDTINVVGSGSDVVTSGLQNNGGATETWNSGDTINGNGKTTVNLILNNAGAGTGSVVDANNIAAINVNLVSNSTVNATEFTNVAAVNVTAGVGASVMTVSNAQLATVFGAALAGRAFTETVTYTGTTGTADTANISAGGTGSSTTNTVFNLGANDIEAVALTTSGTNYFTVNGGTGAAAFTVTGSGTNDITIGTSATAITLDASATTGANTLNLGTGLSTTDVIKGGSGADTLVVDLAAAIQQIPTVTGVETLDLTFTAAGIYNASKTTGVTTLTLTPGAAVSVTNLASTANTINFGTDAAISTAGAANSISYATGSASGAITMNIGATSTTSNPAVSVGATTISNNTAALTVNSIGDATNTIASITDSKATALTINATAQALTVTNALTFAAANTITLNGQAKAITVTGAAANASIVADESLTTLNVTSGAGAVTVSDNIIIAASTAEATVSTVANIAASATKAVTVEDIDVDGNTNGSNVDVTFNLTDSALYTATSGNIEVLGAAAVAGVSLDLNATLNVTALGAGVNLTTNTGGLLVTGGDEQDNISATATLTATAGAIVVDAIDTNTDGDNATANYTLAATGGNVTVTSMDLEATNAADEVTATLAISAAATYTAAIGTLAGTAGAGGVGFDSVTLTGAGTINIGQAGSTMAITTDTVVDASGFTGTLAASFAGAVVGADFNVVLGNTTTTNTIVTGAGADVIVGGSGVDIITGGAGVDNLSGAGGADVFNIAANTDVAAGEVIDGGTGANSLVQLAAAAGSIDLSVATISFIQTLTLDADTGADEYVIGQGFSSGSALTVDGGAIIAADDDTFTIMQSATAFDAAAEATAALVTVAGEWFLDSTGAADILTYWDEVSGVAVNVTLVGSAAGAATGATGNLVYTA